MLTVLYSESKTCYANHSEIATDQVKVELRKWQSNGACDYVIERLVKVDRAVTVKGRQAFSTTDKREAELVRLAIKTFDELLEAHPNKRSLQ